jgi:sporulation protein YlmC with PRC-barrel domain
VRRKIFLLRIIDNTFALAHSQEMSTIALTELLGAPVTEPSGAISGRVREVTLTPAEDPARVSSIVVRTKAGDRLLPLSDVSAMNGGIRATTAASTWQTSHSDGFFLPSRDLLDQQIIDVHGRKVVRVNDVELHPENGTGHLGLKVGSVDVGARGAMRRLLKGVVPMAALKPVLQKIRHG